MSPGSEQRPYSSERLAYWYFRLNGFLTTENFVVHPDTGRNQRTDVDLFAVRFAHRAENLQWPMLDDPRVTCCSTFTNVIIAEVKTGPCTLNGPWSDPEAQNLHRVLKAIGCVPESAVNLACDALYKSGVWIDSITTIRLFALGERKNDELVIPLAQQLTWGEVIDFCVRRFSEYEQQKSSVGQWKEDGRLLKDCALRPDPESSIRRCFGLRQRDVFGGGGP